MNNYYTIHMSFPNLCCFSSITLFFLFSIVLQYNLGISGSYVHAPVLAKGAYVEILFYS